MKKTLFFISLFVAVFFLPKVVLAAKWPNQCIYQGVYNGSVGFTTATVDSSGKAHIDKVDVYTEAFFNKSLNKIKHYTNAVVPIENFDQTGKIKFRDNNDDKQTIKLDNYKIDTNISDCPAYMILINSGYGGTGDYYVLVGDDNLKSFIDSNIPNNDYVKVTYGNLISAADLVDPSDPDDPDSSEDNPYGEATCEGLLGARDSEGNYQEDTTGWLLQKVFDYMKLAAIIMIFAFSAIDYAKAIVDQDADAIKTATIKFGKRLVIGIIIFLLPVLINLILSVIDQSTCGVG